MAQIVFVFDRFHILAADVVIASLTPSCLPLVCSDISSNFNTSRVVQRQWTLCDGLHLFGFCLSCSFNVLYAPLMAALQAPRTAKARSRPLEDTSHQSRAEAYLPLL